MKRFLIAPFIFVSLVALGSSFLNNGNILGSGIFKTSGPATPDTPTPAPTVASVSPTSGAAAGGDALTITGTGFFTGATATVGGVTCTSPNVVSATSLTCTTGAHAAGAVNVVVTNIDGQSGTKTNGFTYISPFAPTDVAGLKFYGSNSSWSSSADSDPVSTWPDLSGLGQDISSSLTERPIVKKAIKNGLDVVRFDGSNDHLDGIAASNYVSTTAFSAWFVVNAKAFNSNASGGSAYQNEAVWTVKTSGDFTVYLRSNGGSPLIGLQNYGTGQTTSVSAAVDTWYVIHVRHDSGNIIISSNNGAESSTASGNTGGLTDLLRVGCNNDTPNSTNCAQIDIGEILIYNTVVGSSDRTSIQSYLNTKWAVY